MIAFDKNHIPYLTVIIDPTGEHPVVMTLNDDWLTTGEYVLSATPLELLSIANTAMQQAANFMADELWEKIAKANKLLEHRADEQLVD